MILHKHAQTVNAFRAIMDIAFVFVAWALAFLLRFESGLLSLPKGPDTFGNYMRLVPLLLTTYLLVFQSTGVYRRSLQRRRVWNENIDLARSHAAAFVAFVAFAYFVYEHRYSRVMLAWYVLFAAVLLPFGRSLVRKANRAYMRSRRENPMPALLIGHGEVARRVEALAAPGNEWNATIVCHLGAHQLEEVHALLQQGNIAVVFVALRPDENIHLAALSESFGNTLAEIVLVPDFGMASLIAPSVTYLDTLPAITLNGTRLDALGRSLKRAFDISFSLAFIVLASPLFLLCAILVRLSSKGPVLYKQERMGLDGRVFQCLKFRGMRVDAETMSGPVWAKKDDDRVTPIGRFLRRTSLDEIPQFFNVLRGDMSVVGPRPERPVFVQDFRHAVPGYMLRHKVKAGITGWAQVNGWRGNTSLEKRIECDLWYIQNWSIWLDVKICLLTPIRGFIHPNAY